MFSILTIIVLIILVLILLLVVFYYTYHSLSCIYWRAKPCTIDTHNTMNLNKEICHTQIPRIIHQIWIGPKNPPMHWINTVIDFCHTNGYVYKLWRDADVVTLGLINKKAFDDEPSWAGKADVLRYEILYRHGGIYIDADSMIINQDRLDLAKVVEIYLPSVLLHMKKKGHV